MQVPHSPNLDLQGVINLINSTETPTVEFLQLTARELNNANADNIFTYIEGGPPMTRNKVVLLQIDPALDAAGVARFVDDKMAANYMPICYADINVPGGTISVVAFRVPPLPAGDGGTADSGGAALVLSWDNSERKAWSAKLIELVTTLQATLEKGNPEGFVAGYDALSAERKIKYWAELFIAVAKYESSWDPQTTYLESDGQLSIGLLQLSIGDQNNYQNLEPVITNENELKDPLVNLQWGVKIFARLLERDGLVARGSGNSSKGAARYWSVLRDGHKVDQIKARVVATMAA